MPSKDRVTVTTHVKKDVYKELTEKAKQQNLSISEAVRRIILKYVQEDCE